jgi:hypothetical protein
MSSIDGLAKETKASSLGQERNTETSHSVAFVYEAILLEIINLYFLVFCFPLTCSKGNQGVLNRAGVATLNRQIEYDR